MTNPKHATSAERARASKLRRRSDLSASEQEWLESYAARHPHVRGRPTGLAEERRLEELDEVVQRVGARQRNEAHAEVDLPPSFFRASAPAEDDAGDDDDDDAGGELGHDGGDCPHPDCPHCRKLDGLAVCGRTGRTIYPPMSEAGAMGAAGMIFGILAIIIAVFKTGTTVAANEHEQKALADALREVQARRVNELGAIDDLLAVGWVLIAFGTRVVRGA